MLIRFLMFALLMMTTSIFAQTMPPIETGVSQSLAKWRAANYSDVRYKLNITLEKGAPLMKGTIEVSVKLTDEGAKNDLILDWRTTQFANDKDKPFAKVTAINDYSTANSTKSVIDDKHLNEDHLIISRQLLKTGENVIKINFASPIKTSGAAITRYVDKEDGAEYVYSLFVPSDASTAFPVFDQPDLKARFSLFVTAPSDWQVISNTNHGYVEFFEVPKDKKFIPKPFIFEETKPISPYVFAFAAGDFAAFGEYLESKDSAKLSDEEKEKLNKKWIAGNGSFIYVRKSQAEKFKKEAAEVFRLNREGVKFLEDWFDYKFPFPKYDLVLIP